MCQAKKALADCVDAQGGPNINALCSPLHPEPSTRQQVMARDAPILLLDDAAAGLDASDVSARHELVRALEGVMAGRTVISVSQRPDALSRSAAMVGVLHNGALAEWVRLVRLELWSCPAAPCADVRGVAMWAVLREGL